MKGSTIQKEPAHEEYGRSEIRAQVKLLATIAEKECQCAGSFCTTC